MLTENTQEIAEVEVTITIAVLENLSPDVAQEQNTTVRGKKAIYNNNFS